MNSRITSVHVKGDRTYTVSEASETVGASQQTIRNWVNRNGMPIVEGALPWLISGHDLKKFASGTRRPGMPKPGPGEMTCMKCRQPRKPYGMMVDYISHDALTGRLSGLCEICESTINLFTSRKKLPAHAEFFDIHERGD